MGAVLSTSMAALRHRHSPGVCVCVYGSDGKLFRTYYFPPMVVGVGGQQYVWDNLPAEQYTHLAESFRHTRGWEPYTLTHTPG